MGMQMGASQLAVCSTAAEVFANYRAVKARVAQWKPPTPKVVKVQIFDWTPKPEVVAVVQPVPVAPVVTPEPPPPVYPSIGQIVGAVCRHYKVSRVDLLSQRRQQAITRPRQVAMWLAKKLTPQSFPQIGRRLGGRDHTTAMYGVWKIDQLRAADEKLQADLHNLQVTIMAGVSNDVG